MRGGMDMDSEEILLRKRLGELADKAYNNS